MVKNNVIFNFCLKFSGVFAIVSFLIVLGGAVFNRVEFNVIIERIVLAELIFAPMGFLIGFVLSNILKNVIFTEDGKITLSASAQSVGVSENKEVNKNIEAEQNIESEEDIKGGNLDIHDSTDDIPMETPVRDYSSSGGATKSKNGDYIIVNDKKIVNDPKVLAEAVKTMINEG